MMTVYKTSILSQYDRYTIVAKIICECFCRTQMKFLQGMLCFWHLKMLVIYISEDLPSVVSVKNNTVEPCASLVHLFYYFSSFPPPHKTQKSHLTTNQTLGSVPSPLNEKRKKEWKGSRSL